MTTSQNPVAAYLAAADLAAAAARQLLPLISASLQAQFPAGAYLVVTRGDEEEDGDDLYLDSIRDGDGTVLRNFAAGWDSVVVAANGATWTEIQQLGMERMPALPPELAALWGEIDPRDPCAVIALINRLDAQVSYALLAPLPGEHQTDDEAEAQEDGGPALLWLPIGLQPAH